MVRRFRMSPSGNHVRQLLDAAQADRLVLVMAERDGKEFHVIAPGRGTRMVTVGSADVPAFLAGAAMVASPSPTRTTAKLAALYPAWSAKLYGSADG